MINIRPRSEQPAEIPRHPKWGGPYVIPPNAKRSWGDYKCETCGRMVEPILGKRSGQPLKSKPKGQCKCEYYKRTTNWIDVIQDEFLLKQWGKRNVAWGMGQRPDLQLAAAACRAPHHPDFCKEDKDELNRIANEAADYAGAQWKASIGTSEHKLTHMMDRGETLGHVPDRWREDLRAYAETTKDIEWHWVESFRVNDELKVAGTVDRIGWYKGRFVVMDIKTGSDWNKCGFAMQLAMYARMTPYNIATDERTQDPHPVDLNVAYLIKLPEGQGICEIEPINIAKGWLACKVARQVWDTRDWEFNVSSGALYQAPSLLEMAQRAGTVEECKLLWRNGKGLGELTPEVQAALKARVIELGGKLR